MRRRRRPNPAEEALWARAVRDAVPLDPGRRVLEAPLAPVVERQFTVSDYPPPHTVDRALPGTRLDMRETRRLQRGEQAIEARLDLHGMTREQAHHALDSFIEHNWRAGRRFLLVITGKGGGLGSGVLKAELPRWIAASGHRGRVLALAEAAPRHGGGGAYYLRLRRRTQPSL